MAEYQVLIKTSGWFLADVEAESESEAKELATDIWNETHFSNLSDVDIENVVVDKINHTRAIHTENP